MSSTAAIVPTNLLAGEVQLNQTQAETWQSADRIDHGHATGRVHIRWNSPPSYGTT